MRALFLAAALTGLATPMAGAQDNLDARTAYVERRGMLELDAACALFAPSIHDAVAVSVLQARGALLRAGWRNADIAEAERATIAAARARPCNDPRTASAAAAARRSYLSWVNAGTMRFPGWEREWVARRSDLAQGWRLAQDIDAPVRATFGVRDLNTAQRLTLLLTLGERDSPPRSVTLVLRNPARPRRQEVNLAQRVSGGLAAGAPEIGAAKSYSGERGPTRHNQIAFLFPDAAFNDLVALDPRESAELRIDGRRAPVYVEVGDIAAARGFLTIRR